MTAPCTHPMTVASLFDGIGGGPEAFRRAGAVVVATCEIDKAAAGVAADHFPEAKAFTDVTELTADDLLAAGFCPVCGVVVAGWPCQGNSVAGLRGGMADPRSGLWKQIVRLLDETQPAWFVGENVPGLLSVNKGDDIRVVLGDLEDLGYLVELSLHDAQFFGVPQRRRRVFFTCRNLARLVETKTTTSALTLAQCLIEISLLTFIVQSQEYGNASAPWASHAACADGLSRRIKQFGMLRQAESGWSTWLPSLAGRSARQALAQDTSASPPGDSTLGPLTPATGTSSPDTTWPQVATSLSTESSWRALLDELLPLAKSSITSPPTNWTTAPGTSTSARMLLNISAYIAALTSSCPTFSQPASSASTAIEVLTNYARQAANSLLGSVDGIHDHVGLHAAAGRTQLALRGTGRAGRAPAEVLLEPEGGSGSSGEGGAAGSRTTGRGAVGTLQGGGKRGYRVDAEAAAGGHLVTAGTGNGIRRLTPMEWERLQGYPSGWTAHSGGRPQADSARYRQLGNSYAVPVVEWIARRIVGWSA